MSYMYCHPIFQRPYMDIQLVCFDTSFIRSQSKNIEILYPTNKHLHCVAEPTDLELNDVVGKNPDDASSRKRAFELCLKMDALLPRGQVLLNEIEGYIFNKKLRQDFVLCNSQIQDVRRKGILEKEQQMIQKLENRIKEMEYYENYYWSCIRVTNASPINIGFKHIEDNVNEIVKNEIKVDNRIDISKLYLADSERFKSDCPSSYNYIKTLSFINVLSKPKESSKQFTVIADGNSLTIQKSYVTDLIIAASFLPYLDTFATSDKGQADTLKFLFKEYVSKIKYHSPS